MTARRRNLVGSSETRARLLDTAELVMKEEGYPAVTTRRLASRMGVSNQLVHYYFRTMDELFISLIRRGAERNISRLIRAITSENPLHALLKLYGDTDVVRLQIEYLALINHRKELAAEAARHTEHIRSVEAEALAGLLSDSAVDATKYPAKGIVVILSAVGRIMSIEKTVGISFGHAAADAIMNRLIGLLEPGHGNKAKATKDSPVGPTRTRRMKRSRLR